jgi:subtilisin-like proprotein convertase family protein
MLDMAPRRSLPRLLLLIWIAVAACGDDDAPSDDGGDSDSGSDEMRDGGGGRAGSGGVIRLDGGFRDAGADAGDADVPADEDAGSPPISCARDADCHDDDAFTEDECENEVCRNTSIETDDRNACTIDSCDSTLGVQHDPVVVDDGDACTTDSCSPTTGVAHAPCASGVCDTTEICLDAITTTFTDSPGLAIPDGPAGVVSDTIQVSGLGTRLWDVNARTTITHAFSADLDITLQSPAGTIVTLTTDNGPGANVFNGTVWNDSANPGGAVPYSSNIGLVTDHPYVSGTTATPLVPEEALGAFIGENPNGTWTLTVSDDDTVAVGALASWGLELTTISTAPTTVVETISQTTTMPIADQDTTTSSLVVPASASGSRVCSVTVNTNITHTYNHELWIALSSPSGTIVTLTAENGFDPATGDNLDNVYAGTLWDDNANPLGQVPYVNDINNGLATDHGYADLTVATPLAPEEALSAFIGDMVAGTWTLTVADGGPGDTGAINSWSLNVGRCLR